MHNKQYITRKQASKYARLSSTSTIYEWVSSELLTTYTEEKLIDRNELDRLLEFRKMMNEKMKGKTIKPWQDQWLDQKEELLGGENKNE